MPTFQQLIFVVCFCVVTCQLNTIVFDVEPSMHNSLVASTRDVQCSVSFTTNPDLKPSTSTDDASVSDDIEDAKELLRSILVKRQDSCITTQTNSFVYSLCFGKEIKQVLAAKDTWILGTFEEKEMKQINNVLSVELRGGTVCEAQQSMKRSTQLFFSCAARPSLISVDESPTCIYQARVGLPELCDSSVGAAMKWFQPVAPAAPQQTTALTDPNRRWHTAGFVLDAIGTTLDAQLGCHLFDTLVGNLDDIYFESVTVDIQALTTPLNTICHLRARDSAKFNLIEKTVETTTTHKASVSLKNIQLRSLSLICDTRK